MKAAERRILVDTSTLIYATLEDDRRYARSRDLLLAPGGGERFVSAQNLAEMYPNLTGPKLEHPDPPPLALAKILSISALPTLQVLPLTGDVQAIALELSEKYGIVRQRSFDAQLVATMIVHGIGTLLTESARDFAAMKEIRAVDPFAA